MDLSVSLEGEVAARESWHTDCSEVNCCTRQFYWVEAGVCNKLKMLLQKCGRQNMRL